MLKKQKQAIIVTIILIALTVTFFYGPFIGVSIHSHFSARQEILDTAKLISSEESDPQTIVNKIADWLNVNIEYDTSFYYFYPFPPFQLWRQTNPSAEWIMTIKRGGCEEFATLFSGLAGAAGIESRVVHNSAEDHVWSEILINGTWTHFDPGLPLDKRFNNPGVYERPKAEGGWEKQLSYVCFIDENGKQRDITSKYTDVGRLSVHVTKDGTPVENAKVTVKSRFLMENYPGYNQPRLALENFTDKSGLCTFDLGGNNYTVVAEIGQIVGFRDETIVNLKENDTTSVELHPTKLALLLSLGDILIIVMVIAFLLISIFFVIKIIRTRQQKRK